MITPTEKEIEEFCKYVYYETIMYYVKDIDSQGAFIHDEISNTSYVQIIKILISRPNRSVRIYTEDDGSWMYASPEMEKYALHQLDQWGTYKVKFNKNVREWYDAYVVPDLKTAIDVLRM